MWESNVNYMGENWIRTEKPQVSSSEDDGRFGCSWSHSDPLTTSCFGYMCNPTAATLKSYLRESLGMTELVKTELMYIKACKLKDH